VSPGDGRPADGSLWYIRDVTVSFSVQEPLSRTTPVVVEVPHAGLRLDAQTLASLAAPARSIGADADLFVDELYADAPARGAALIVGHMSRYVCDLNRAEGEVDALAVRDGKARAAPHGLIWRSTTEGRPALFAPVSQLEYQRRLDEYHRPYHAALAALVEQRKAKFGFAIVLCAHSMPSRGRDGHTDPGTDRADVVPGTRGRTTADPRVIDLVDELAQGAGLRVVHDHPYRGGYTTGHFGRPHESVHAIQIELARRLYMDERTLERRRGDFERTQAFCARLVEALTELDLNT
jgi:N-formylglutamate deformylase